MCVCIFRYIYGFFCIGHETVYVHAHHECQGDSEHVGLYMTQAGFLLCSVELDTCRPVPCKALATNRQSRAYGHLGRHRWNLASYLLAYQNRKFRIQRYLELYRCSVYSIIIIVIVNGRVDFNRDKVSIFRLSRCIAQTACICICICTSEIMPSEIIASTACMTIDDVANAAADGEGV